MTLDKLTRLIATVAVIIISMGCIWLSWRLLSVGKDVPATLWCLAGVGLGALANAIVKTNAP